MLDHNSIHLKVRQFVYCKTAVHVSTINLTRKPASVAGLKRFWSSSWIVFFPLSPTELLQGLTMSNSGRRGEGLIRNKNCLSFVSTRIHPQVFWGDCVARLSCFLCCVFVLFISVLCLMPTIACVFGLSNATWDYPLNFLNVYLYLTQFLGQYDWRFYIFSVRNGHRHHHYLDRVWDLCVDLFQLYTDSVWQNLHILVDPLHHLMVPINSIHIHKA